MYGKEEYVSGAGEAMTGKQWLVITFVVIVNIILFGALLGPPPGTQGAVAPAASWTPCPTFTASPFPTATAIVMPTTPPLPTAVVHAMSSGQGYIVQEGDTVESIAARYDIGAHTLRMLNRLSEGYEIEVGQELLVPAAP
jgi:LysM repeat protein